mgnify:CR=1 FL=1
MVGLGIWTKNAGECTTTIASLDIRLGHTLANRLAQPQMPRCHQNQNNVLSRGKALKRMRSTVLRRVGLLVSIKRTYLFIVKYVIPSCQRARILDNFAHHKSIYDHLQHQLTCRKKSTTPLQVQSHEQQKSTRVVADWTSVCTYPRQQAEQP